MATSTLGWSPGRQDVVIGDVDLEGGDAGQGAGRGPDLGREVRQRGQVVAEQGGRVGEAVPGELHPIAGVAGEADDGPVQVDNGSLTRSGIGHDGPFADLTARQSTVGAGPTQVTGG